MHNSIGIGSQLQKEHKKGTEKIKNCIIVLRRKKNENVSKNINKYQKCIMVLKWEKVPKLQKSK